MKSESIRGIFNLLGPKASRWLIIATISGCFLGVVEVGLASLIQQILQLIGLISVQTPVFLSQIAPRSPLGLFTLFTVVIVMRSTLNFITKQASCYSFNVFLARSRTKLLNLLLFSRNARITSSDAHFHLTDTFPKTGEFFFSLSNFASGLLQAFVTFIAMFITDPLSSAVGGGLMILGYFSTRKINRLISILARSSPNIQSALTASIERIARNLFLVRATNLEDLEFERTSREVLRYAGNQTKMQALSNFNATMPQLLGTIILIGLLVFHYYVPSSAPGQFVAFLYLFVRCAQVLAGISAAASSMISTRPCFQTSLKLYYFAEELGSARSITDVTFWGTIETSMGDLSRQSRASWDAKPRTSPPRIEFAEVSFRYDIDQPYVIKNFSQIFEAGKITTITGESGRGKSTLLGILLGLLNPETGSIRVDDYPISSGVIGNIFRVGYVGAESFLIGGTIKDNILYGSQGEDSELLHQVLEEAKLDVLVANLKDGLEHCINEHGDGLSMGQKQRLALARALYRKPNILILDEATANLDEKTEEELIPTILSLAGRVTIVAATHRARLVRIADHHIQL